MRIWTIQPAGLYETLKAKGVLLADGRRADRYFHPAYNWMIDQMRHRLPPSRARFPWWGWYRYEGLRRAKPDLRAGGYLRKGQKGVRIELEMSDAEVLLSDFDDWWWVLDNSFFPHDIAEQDRFWRQAERVGHENDGRYPELLRSKVLASWDRIFDIKRAKHNWLGRFPARSIQATFWELRLKDVRDVTHFTAR